MTFARDRQTGIDMDRDIDRDRLADHGTHILSCEMNLIQKCE